jgi:molybdopterin/thiamine biosynthesis adenylyltransferase
MFCLIMVSLLKDRCYRKGETMKVLLIGAGGVGSWACDELSRLYYNGQIPAKVEITIADDDLVEMQQIKYQNFKSVDAGLNKAKALANRYEMIVGLKTRITKESQLKDYDFFILCVDNEAARKLVIEYCHRKKKEFIDVRATGRQVTAQPKTSLKENMKLVTPTDSGEYSCQNEATLKKGQYDLGNRISALIAAQMFLNYLRGLKNHTINEVI